MAALYSFQELELTNDDVFECATCENICQCFNTEGNETNFCPSCGSRDLSSKQKTTSEVQE